MSLELLKNNINKELNIVHECKDLNEKLIVIQNKPNFSQLEKDEANIIVSSLNALYQQIDILNNSIPDLLKNISFYNPLSDDSSGKMNIDNGNKSDKSNKSKTNILEVKYSVDNSNEKLGIKKEDQKKFLENLTSYQKLIPKLKKESSFNAFDPYILISNKMFRKTSNFLLEKGYFKDIKNDLRKITSPLLLDTYLSMSIFSTFISLFAGLLIGVLFYFLSFGIGISIATIFFIPILVFFMFIIYPSSKRKSLDKEINQELPFMTIYMAAIATSGIEPSKIFDIVVSSKEYPAIQREVKKLTNYINFYGYDLVSSLKKSAQNCPSERLAQLFDGLATTITSGGELTTYLSKHSETLLFDYRLEREKYTHIAETFMSIYISVVIAAPMILMILFILMSLAKFGINMSIQTISFLTVIIVGLLNVLFLSFLNMKQPKF